MSPMFYDELTQGLTTIIDFLRFGISQANKAGLYYGHGTDNAQDDVYALVFGMLSLPWDMDKSLLQAKLTKAEIALLNEALHRRIIERVPVPYLTHQAYFCDLSFYVDERVLIPRSPMAELIKQQFSPWIDPSKVHRILDMCTGSGCIAIACAYAFPEASVEASDLSPDALAVATMNEQQHQVGLKLHLSDCFQDIPKVRYDLIVSNPPYVGAEEMQTLPAEYLHEPNMALETPDNGLSIVKRMLESAADYLTEHGILVVEVGNSQDALCEAYPDLPFTWLDFEQGGQGVFLLTRDQLYNRG